MWTYPRPKTSKFGAYSALFGGLFGPPCPKCGEYPPDEPAAEGRLPDRFWTPERVLAFIQLFWAYIEEPSEP